MYKIYGVWKYTLFSMYLFVIPTLTSNSIRELDPIRGTYHTWWVITRAPIDLVQKLIDESKLGGSIELMAPTWPSWNESNFHPLIFELGREFDCGPVFPSWLRSNFNEFKFEIPFVTQKNGNQKALNFKYILYEDSTVESTSSQLFYGLDARKGKFITNNETYDINYNGTRLHTLVASKGSWKNASTYPYFKVYEDAMALPWFGIKGTSSCARHNYDFTTAIIRPILGSLQVDPNMLGIYSTPIMPFFGLNEDMPWGAVEVHVNFTMSLPKDCSSI